MTPAGSGHAPRRSRVIRLGRALPGFARKNRGLAVNPAFWAMGPRLVAARARARPAPDAPLAFVATHHKVMTTYFNAVLQPLAFGLNRRFQRVNTEQPSPGAQIVLSMHGKLDLAGLGRYRGVHIMRDPRDMIVSGYHYHKWTLEEWVHRPDANGRSYQQKLAEADPHDGLFLEIDHFIYFYRQTLADWDIANPDVIEIAYEDLMGPERDTLYARIFSHLGLDGRDLALACDLMRLFAAQSRTGRKPGAVAGKSHLRSGKAGQWKQELCADHLAYIERELGPILRKFGYGPDGRMGEA